MMVSSDDRCQVQSRELFKPNTRYEAEKSADGSIRMTEFPAHESPPARLVRRDGRMYLDTATKLTNRDVAAVLEQPF